MPTPFGRTTLDDLFDQHAPLVQHERTKLEIRKAAKVFADVILAETTPSADQSAAIRHVVDAMATALHAVETDGRY